MSSLQSLFIVLACIFLAIFMLIITREEDENKKMQDVLRMGRKGLKVFWIFGYVSWGSMRPSRMWLVDGRCFVPLFLGLWIRYPERDRV